MEGRRRRNITTTKAAGGLEATRENRRPVLQQRPAHGSEARGESRIGNQESSRIQESTRTSTNRPECSSRCGRGRGVAWARGASNHERDGFGRHQSRQTENGAGVLDARYSLGHGRGGRNKVGRVGTEDIMRKSADDGEDGCAAKEDARDGGGEWRRMKAKKKNGYG